MSVVTARSEQAPIPTSLGPVPHQKNVALPSYRASPPYTASMQSLPYQISPVSPHSNNYYHPIPPAIHSPTSAICHNHVFKDPSTKQGPSEPVSKRIPPGVYGYILNQLQYLHTGPSQSSCVTCFQRDLRSLALTSRAWEKAVRNRLYNRIHIIGNDSPAQLKRYRLKRGSRLKLLRRTLRERKLLANLVLELHVPELEQPSFSGKQTIQWHEYRDLIASVIMACPNLERLVGLAVPYHHKFDRLTYALSTRKKLRAHAWIIGGALEGLEQLRSHNPLGAFEFLDYHARWTNLETLMLHSLNTNDMMEHGIFLRIFNHLPSLRNLYVSGFDAHAFTNRTLLFLPALECLRLESLHGVTDTGISQYTSRKEAHTLKSLTLIEQNIKSLLVISKILASLPNLERFGISQANTCPTVPSDAMVLQPILASSSLKYLHWDMVGPNSGNTSSKIDSTPFVTPLKHADTPNLHLAQSILHAGFPCLEQLRAPSDIDPPGVLQALCQPVKNGQALIPSDRYSLPRSSHGSVNVKPLALPSGNNLTSARIRAQTFIDMAARDTETGMKIIVTDYSDSYMPDSALEAASDSGSDLAMDELGAYPTDKAQKGEHSCSSDSPVKVQEFRMPAVMGQVGLPSGDGERLIPRITLRPDIPGADADGGLVGWKHFLAANLPSPYAAELGYGPLYSRSRSSFTIDEPFSPSSRFTAWSSFSGRPGTASNSVSPSSSSTSMTFSLSNAPPWTRDTCNGAWNQSHPKGKEWWYHVERDRPGNMEIIELKQFF